jgi:hypothetical protein
MKTKDKVKHIFFQHKESEMRIDHKILESIIKSDPNVDVSDDRCTTTGSQINFLYIIANWATEIFRLLAQIKKQ